MKQNQGQKKKWSLLKYFSQLRVTTQKKLISSYVFRQLQLEGQMECMDDIDPQVFDEFKALKVRLAQLVCLHF